MKSTFWKELEGEGHLDQYRESAGGLRKFRLEGPRGDENESDIRSRWLRRHLVHSTVPTCCCFCFGAVLGHSKVRIRTKLHLIKSFVSFAIFSYAVGTAHGFALINYQQNRVLTAKCTLDPNALGNTSSTTPSSIGHATLIRGRSLKKSLRESFRRFRKGRSTKKSTMLPTTPRIDENSPLSPANVHLEEITRVPVERQVEFREFKPNDEQVLSMVRCLYFAKTYLNSGKATERALTVPYATV